MPVWLVLSLRGHVGAEIRHQIDRHSEKSNRSTPHLEAHALMILKVRLRQQMLEGTYCV